MAQSVPDLPASAEGEWFTVRQAAFILSCSPRSLYRAVRSGALRAAPINGRGDLRIHRDDIGKWLEGAAERHVTQDR
jgi:excisionase family DNA binding protein